MQVMSVNKFSREDIKSLLIIAIGIALVVIAIRFFIYLLPVIIVALIIMLLYDSYKKNDNFPWKKKNKDKANVQDATVISEKKIKKEEK